jgi:hypothetical protein
MRPPFPFLPRIYFSIELVDHLLRLTLFFSTCGLFLYLLYLFSGSGMYMSRYYPFHNHVYLSHQYSQCVEARHVLCIHNNDAGSHWIGRCVPSHAQVLCHEGRSYCRVFKVQPMLPTVHAMHASTI